MSLIKLMSHMNLIYHKHFTLKIKRKEQWHLKLKEPSATKTPQKIQKNHIIKNNLLKKKDGEKKTHSPAHVAFGGTRIKSLWIVFGLNSLGESGWNDFVTSVFITWGCTTVTGISNIDPFSTQPESYALILFMETEQMNKKTFWLQNIICNLPGGVHSNWKTGGIHGNTYRTWCVT